MREYVLSILGSLLCGVIRQERFYIWTGDGKNQLVELCRKAFGEYCCDFPADLLYTVKKGEKKERERERKKKKKKKKTKRLPRHVELSSWLRVND
jgi:hypothetical protein